MIVRYGLRPHDMALVESVANAYAAAGATATRGATAHDVRPYLTGITAELAAHRLLGLVYDPPVLSREQFQQVSGSRLLHSDVMGFNMDIKASSGRLTWFVREAGIDDEIIYVGAVVETRKGFLPLVKFYGGSSGETVRRSRRPHITEITPGREASQWENRMLHAPFTFSAPSLFQPQSEPTAVNGSLARFGLQDQTGHFAGPDTDARQGAS